MYLYTVWNFRISLVKNPDIKSILTDLKSQKIKEDFNHEELTEITKIWDSKIIQPSFRRLLYELEMNS